MSDLYVFIHVPKTGGSTFAKEIMEKNMRAIRFPRGCIPAGGWDSYVGVHGHDKIINAENSRAFAGRNKIYITFLREPVRRLLSFYYFVDHSDSIEKWLIDNRQNLQNRSVWHLSSLHNTPPNRDDLESAMVNIEGIELFLTDRFDESLIRLKNKYPIFSDISYKKRNITKKNYNFESQPDRVKSMLYEYTELDRELYNYAKKIFENDK